MTNVYGPGSPLAVWPPLHEYDAVLVWLWPNEEYLRCLHELVDRVRTVDGRIRILTAIDDVSLAVRNLFDNAIVGGMENDNKDDNNNNNNNNNNDLIVNDQEKGNGEGKDEKRSKRSLSHLEVIEDFLLATQRHPDLVGTDELVAYDRYYDLQFEERIYSAVFLFHLELYLYAMADVTIGLNSRITSFLERAVPGTPSRLLRYVAPTVTGVGNNNEHGDGDGDGESRAIPPFRSRKDYLFFGYINPANAKLLEWFHDHVFSELTALAVDHQFHIAGMVTEAAPSFCDCSKRGSSSSSGSGSGSANVNASNQKCAPLYPNVVCHGGVAEEELDKLIRSVRVSVNTVKEPSGVATKSCRSLSWGTPVVASNLDGTFASETPAAATLCDSSDDDSSKKCVVEALHQWLTNETKWTQSSVTGPSFVAKHFGGDMYRHDWNELLDLLSLSSNQTTTTTTTTKMPYNVVIEGDAVWRQEGVSTSQPQPQARRRRRRRRQQQQQQQQQNWYLAKALAMDPSLRVIVMGRVDPPLAHVLSVDTPLDLTFNPAKPGGMFEGHTTQSSPFPTGFQAHVLVRHWDWERCSFVTSDKTDQEDDNNNNNNNKIAPLKLCGVGCRVVAVVSETVWGSFPPSFIKGLDLDADVVWASTEHVRRALAMPWDNNNHGNNDINLRLQSKTVVVPPAFNCNALVDFHRLNDNNNNKDTVTFVAVGTLDQEDGIDVVLEAWVRSKLCHANDALLRLRIHSSRRHSHSHSHSRSHNNCKDANGAAVNDVDAVTATMPRATAAQCSNVHWTMDEDDDDDEVVENQIEEDNALWEGADVYVTAQRTDSLDPFLVAALSMGLAVVRPVRDDIVDVDVDTRTYHVHTSVEPCRRHPCIVPRNSEACVMLECDHDPGQGGNNECSCHTLVKPPVWSQAVDPVEWNHRMEQAYHDIKDQTVSGFASQSQSQSPSRSRSEGAGASCGSPSLQAQYVQQMRAVMKRPRTRRVQSYQILEPKTRKAYDESKKWRRRLRLCILVLVVLVPTAAACLTVGLSKVIWYHRLTLRSNHPTTKRFFFRSMGARQKKKV